MQVYYGTNILYTAKVILKKIGELIIDHDWQSQDFQIVIVSHFGSRKKWLSLKLWIHAEKLH